MILAVSALLAFVQLSDQSSDLSTLGLEKYLANYNEKVND